MGDGVAVVTSEQVAAYEGMVLSHARRFASLPDMQNMLDDFAQEGRIAVWKALKDGYLPSNEVVGNAMKMAARTERRKGLAGFDELDEHLHSVR